MPEVRKDLDLSFQEFFSSCKKEYVNNDVKRICEPLQKSIRIRRVKKVFIILVFCCIVILMCNSFECISWFGSALGRLFMIKLLPLWDWTNLYSEKCLLKFPQSEPEIYLSTVKDEQVDTKDCILCERYDQIHVVQNASFFFLRQQFFEKGLPVLIQDSNRIGSLMETVYEMRLAQEFVESDPCDVETNLMMTKFLNIDDLLISIEGLHTKEEWFCQLRNCQIDAIKASRSFIEKPYFYQPHFEPFYSSWILMSRNYRDFHRELTLKGFIILQQIAGELLATLKAKEPCEEICGQKSVVVYEGEALVFLTELWTFSYTFQGIKESVTFITETNWDGR